MIAEQRVHSNELTADEGCVAGVLEIAGRNQRGEGLGGGEEHRTSTTNKTMTKSRLTAMD